MYRYYETNSRAHYPYEPDSWYYVEEHQKNESHTFFRGFSGNGRFHSQNSSLLPDFPNDEDDSPFQYPNNVRQPPFRSLPSPPHPFASPLPRQNIPFERQSLPKNFEKRSWMQATYTKGETASNNMPWFLNGAPPDFQPRNYNNRNRNRSPRRGYANTPFDVEELSDDYDSSEASRSNPYNHDNPYAPRHRSAMRKPSPFRNRSPHRRVSFNIPDTQELENREREASMNRDYNSPRRPRYPQQSPYDHQYREHYPRGRRGRNEYFEEDDETREWDYVDVDEDLDVESGRYFNY